MDTIEISNTLLMIIAGGTILNGLILVIGVCAIISYLHHIWESVILGFSILADDIDDTDDIPID